MRERNVSAKDPSRNRFTENIEVTTDIEIEDKSEKERSERGMREG